MKPFRVVCITDQFKWSFPGQPNAKPVKGEIYTVFKVNQYLQGTYYQIVELASDEEYLSSCFRELDDTFGEAVCERIEQQIEYEKVLEYGSI